LRLARDRRRTPSVPPERFDRRLAERDDLRHILELIEDAEALIEIESDGGVRHALADLLPGRAADDVAIEEGSWEIRD
jgi:hypothetical protein